MEVNNESKETTTLVEEHESIIPIQALNTSPNSANRRNNRHMSRKASYDK